jgi:predicted RNA-binding Zn-ribbon protein involved in translation (DUF1610 family)
MPELAGVDGWSSFTAHRSEQENEQTMTSTCRRGDPPPKLRSPNPCNIRAEVKRRDGHPLWWCDVHGEAASGPGGVALVRCPGADAAPSGDSEILDLDLDDFPGGVGVWVALPPVVAMGAVPSTDDVGVHVHARRAPHDIKVIDHTFQIVHLHTDGLVFRVDAEDALAHLVTRLAGQEVSSMQCPRCGYEHLDRDAFAVRPHRRHQCQRCGRFFWARTPSIGNGVGMLAEVLSDRQDPAPAPGKIDLQTDDFGSIEIWGSTPAILWTGPAVERSGLHVHATDRCGNLLVDETFGRLTLGGINLDPDLVRLLMVQRAFPPTRTRITSLGCPACGAPLVDHHAAAFIPSNRKVCAACGTPAATPRKKKVVLNPLANTLPGTTT